VGVAALALLGGVSALAGRRGGGEGTKKAARAKKGPENEWLAGTLAGSEKKEPKHKKTKKG